MEPARAERLNNRKGGEGVGGCDLLLLLTGDQHDFFLSQFNSSIKMLNINSNVVLVILD